MNGAEGKGRNKRGVKKKMTVMDVEEEGWSCKSYLSRMSLPILTIAAVPLDDSSLAFIKSCAVSLRCPSMKNKSDDMSLRAA